MSIHSRCHIICPELTNLMALISYVLKFEIFSIIAYKSRTLHKLEA